MLTLKIAIKSVYAHGQLPSSNIMSLKNLRQHFQFSPRNSMKSMLTAMYTNMEMLEGGRCQMLALLSCIVILKLVNY